MKKKSLKYILPFLLIACGQMARAQPQMSDAAEGSYTNYFHYYFVGNPSMPRGFDIVSRAVMAIEAPTSHYLETQSKNINTLFTIHTFTNQPKVCACTTASFLDGVNIPADSIIAFDSYQNYLGGANINDPSRNLTTSSYLSTLHAKVLYVGNYGVLLELNTDELVTDEPATLGYTFQGADFNPGIFRSIHHSLAGPQRALDSMKYDDNETDLLPAGLTALSSRLRSFNNISWGAGGAPVLYDRSPGIPAVSGIIKGMLLNNERLIPDNELIGRDHGLKNTDPAGLGHPWRFYYNNGMVVSSMSELMPAIRKRCWLNKSAEEILNSSLFAISTFISNRASIINFQQARSIINTFGWTSAADVSFKTANPGSVLVKGSSLTISCPPPSAPDMQKIYGSARAIYLQPGFEYKAAGNYELQMNSAIYSTGTPASAKSSSEISTAAGSNDDRAVPASPALNFIVQPNPSITGVFKLTVPAAESGTNYNLTITALDGRQLGQQRQIKTGERIRLDLSAQPHGIYILNVYESNKIVYTAQLVY